MNGDTGGRRQDGGRHGRVLRGLLAPSALALIVSLLAHFQAFWGLAQLPKGQIGDATGQEAGPVELAFLDLSEALPEAPDVPSPVPRSDRPRRLEPEPEQPKPDVPSPAALEAEPVLEADRQPVPEPDTQQRTAVTQRAENPDEVPNNPRYIAEQNNRVEDETVASVRNDVRDDPVQQLPGAEDPVEAPRSEEGNARDSASADPEGQEEARVEEPQHSEVAEATATEPAASAVAPAPGVEGPRGESATESATAVARLARELLTVEAAAGFQVPSESGEAEGSSEASAAERAGRNHADHRHANLRLGFGSLNQVVSEEQLETERSRFVQAQRARLRGSNRNQRWAEFRSAIENYVARVRPGNQTALNAAASPFAAYLATMHRKIHRLFAHGFLGILPRDPNHPMSDRSLNTRLEIILNRDGTVHRIGVVKPSGQLVFDHGAFSAVRRAAPFGAAPPGILSDDGYVYMHWGFYRNQRQCSTFNARPYLVRASQLRDG